MNETTITLNLDRAYAIREGCKELYFQMGGHLKEPSSPLLARIKAAARELQLEMELHITHS